MKKLISLAALTIMVSCGNSEKVSETPKKVWVCDSIMEHSFDSTGTEIVKASVKCDSVLEEPKK